jgi:hypothetical protein
MKYCINHPGSLGDILFTVKIAEELSKKGEVYWYISPVFWESGVSRVITSANIGPDVPRNIPDATYINLCDLTERPDPDVMTKKYDSVGIDWSDWKDYLKYNRDYDNENELKEFLGISDGDRYILVNERYGINQVHNGVKNTIPKDYDGKIIEMNIFNEATIFDWCGVFENAEEIHTVDTSMQYVLETLDLKASRIVAHPRHYKYTIAQVSKLFNQPWEWVEYERDVWRQLVPNEAE